MLGKEQAWAVLPLPSGPSNITVKARFLFKNSVALGIVIHSFHFNYCFYRTFGRRPLFRVPALMAGIKHTRPQVRRQFITDLAVVFLYDLLVPRPLVAVCADATADFHATAKGTTETVTVILQPPS